MKGCMKTMIILVVNAGSSSLKYQLIDMKDESVIAKGNCDRIGIDGHISHKTFDGRTLNLHRTGTVTIKATANDGSKKTVSFKLVITD